MIRRTRRNEKQRIGMVYRQCPKDHKVYLTNESDARSVPSKSMTLIFSPSPSNHDTSYDIVFITVSTLFAEDWLNGKADLFSFHQ